MLLWGLGRQLREAGGSRSMCARGEDAGRPIRVEEPTLRLDAAPAESVPGVLSFRMLKRHSTAWKARRRATQTVPQQESHLDMGL